MRRSARDSATARELVARLQAGDTGFVVVEEGAAWLRAALWVGQLVGAEASDDHDAYARLLMAHRLLNSAQVQAALATAPSRRFHALFSEVSDASARRILADRFRENMVRLITSIGAPRFQAAAATFVDSVQLPEDPTGFLKECARIADQAARLPDRAVVSPGPTAPRTPLQRLVLHHLAGQELPLEQLLHEVPLESHSAKSTLWEMAQLGQVIVVEEEEEEDLGQEDLLTSEQTLAEISLDGLSGMGLLESPAAEPPPQPPPVAEASPSQGVGDIRSYQDWLNSVDDVPEDELDFFADHDAVRGGETEGGFTTDTHNLDRVEVNRLESSTLEQALRGASGAGNPAAPPGPLAAAAMPSEDDADVDLTLEAEEAPSAMFGGPLLSRDEAHTKLRVANQVLRTLCAALDEAEGSGRGKAMIQLLVDGSPSRYATVLARQKVSPKGELPAERVLEALGERPPTEQRALLNQLLADLIERVLNAAADELSDDLFEPLLEDVAGYRQRLGL